MLRKGKYNKIRWVLNMDNILTAEAHAFQLQNHDSYVIFIIL